MRIGRREIFRAQSLAGTPAANRVVIWNVHRDDGFPAIFGTSVYLRTSK